MMPRTRTVAIALLITCASACGVTDQDHAEVAADKSVPFELLEPDAPPLVPPATATETELVPLCFVRDDAIVGVRVMLDAPANPEDAVAALEDPPDSASGPLRTATADPAIVRSVTLANGIASVDLRPAVSDLSGDDQLLAVAQLVCTLTGRAGIGQVSFTLEGAPVDVPRGDGSLTDEPVSRDDYEALFG
jgi:spore germination protein GerM